MFWIIGAVVAALVIALILVLVLGGNQYNPASDPECRYTYSYCYEDSTLLVRIEGDFDEGCSWTAEGFREGVVKVSPKEAHRSSAVFLIEPVNTGATPISFVLGKTEGSLPDLRYEILVSVSVDGEGMVSAAGSRYWEYAPLSVNGEGSAHPYMIAGFKNGTAALLFGGSGETSWAVAGEAKEFVKVERSQNEEGETVYRIVGIADGEGELIFFEAAESLKLTVNVRASADGMAVILSHEMSSFNGETEILDEEERGVREMTGLVGVPAGAEEIGWSCGDVDYGTGDGEKTARIGMLSYVSGETGFVLQAVSGMTEEDFLAYCFLTGQSHTGTEISGREAAVYDCGDGETAVSLKNGEDVFLHFKAVSLSEGEEEPIGKSELLAELADLLALIPEKVS